ncbi:MAG TPA: hypothetical protein VMK12_29840 [Anaeromyxobacteraceae bacterium]|nr:hypothetical protein [Anaeromyxobacteraceae bacterium]
MAAQYALGQLRASVLARTRKSERDVLNYQGDLERTSATAIVSA